MELWLNQVLGGAMHTRPLSVWYAREKAARLRGDEKHAAMWRARRLEMAALEKDYGSSLLWRVIVN